MTLESCRLEEENVEIVSVPRQKDDALPTIKKTIARVLVRRLGQFCGQEWKREVGCCDVLVVGDASRFWTCSRAEGGGEGGADISIVFEQQP